MSSATSAPASIAFFAYMSAHVNASAFTQICAILCMMIWDILVTLIDHDANQADTCYAMCCVFKHADRQYSSASLQMVSLPLTYSSRDTKAAMHGWVALCVVL